MKQTGKVCKKLLVMGANIETIPLIQAAQKMGVQVGVTDFNPTAPAKRFGDFSYNIDGFDIDGLVKLAREKQFDGVLVGVADRLVDPYRQVCERLNFPCYTSEKQCEILTNKLEFNGFCEKFGIKPIPSYDVSPKVQDDELLGLVFPLLVKPVDANSGKGMAVCCNAQELKMAIQHAISVSSTGKYLVERYMECDDLLMYFTFKDGECWISALGDRYTYRGESGAAPVCVGATYPSRHADLYFSTLHEKFCRMFTDLEIKNGVLLVSGFVEGNNIYVYDPGFRLQGEAPNLHLAALNGFDQCQMLVRFALTGNMGPENLASLNDVDFGGMNAATIWFLVKQGRIHEVKGLDEVGKDPAVYNVVQRLFPGDEVTEDMEGTETQVLARVYLACEGYQSLRQEARRIHDMVSVVDPTGETILLNSLGW